MAASPCPGAQADSRTVPGLGVLCYADAASPAKLLLSAGDMAGLRPTPTLPKGVTLTGVTAWSATTALVNATAPGDVGLSFMTTDGGTSWQRLPIAGFGDSGAWSATSGWLVGLDGKLWVEHGGTGWTAASF